MPDNREEFLLKFTRLFELIFRAHNTRLFYVRYGKLPQRNETFPK